MAISVMSHTLVYFETDIGRPMIGLLAKVNNIGSLEHKWQPAPEVVKAFDCLRDAKDPYWHLVRQDEQLAVPGGKPAGQGDT